MLIAAVLLQIAGKDTVVGKGKAVRQIMEGSTEPEPLQRRLHTAFMQLLRQPGKVLAGVFRVVSMQKPMVQGTSCIGDRIQIRLHAAQQKQVPPYPI